jgi:hypothetical protein
VTRWSAIVAAFLAACASSRIVTVVVPYVPVLHLEPTNQRWLGAASCDVQGQPVIWLHPALSASHAPWVLLHERVHVLQMESAGGCERFDRRVRADSMYRLRMEAESYCAVLEGQRLAHQTWVGPPYASIVRQLLEDYSYNYARDSVIAALPCRE